MPFAIYHEGVMLGFFILSYVRAKDPIAKGKYYVWRLMTEKHFRKNAYGRQGMERALKLVRAFPYGKAEEVTLSYEPDNHAARRFYAFMGFRERGGLDDVEQVTYLRLLAAHLYKYLSYAILRGRYA